MTKRLTMLDRAIKSIDEKIAALQAARAELLDQQATLNAQKSKT